MPGLVRMTGQLGGESSGLPDLLLEAGQTGGGSRYLPGLVRPSPG